jgi:cation transport ATPase
MLRQKRVSPERDGKKPSKASKDSPEEVAMREKLAKARKRQEMEKAERRQQMEEERVRYPEDEEEEQEEQERKKKQAESPRLTSGVIVGNALLALIFVSLPLSDDDYKGAALMAAFNVVWTLLFHQNGWMDYAVLVGSNMLLAVYANKIVTEFHKVPGLLPPEQWAVLIGSNSILAFAYWWKFIRKAPEEDKESHWNVVVLGLFFSRLRYCGLF